MNLRKSLLDSTEHLLMPIDFQIRMQPALHQHTSPAEFDGLANLVVDGFQIENVAFFGPRSLQRAIESTEGTKFRTKICIVDVAVDDVGDHALRMELTSEGIRLHADTDEIVGAKEIQGLVFGQRHEDSSNDCKAA